MVINGLFRFHSGEKMGIQVGNTIQSLEVFFAACVANFFPKTACLQLLNSSVKNANYLSILFPCCSCCDAPVAMPTLHKKTVSSGKNVMVCVLLICEEYPFKRSPGVIYKKTSELSGFFFFFFNHRLCFLCLSGSGPQFHFMTVIFNSG